VLAVAVASLLLTGTASAGDPWPADDVDSRVRSEGRGLDQAANPAYQRALKHYDPSDGIDPFRRNWSGDRGHSMPVTFPNRYGVKLAGHLYHPKLPWSDPVTGKLVRGPLPAVVLLPGLSKDRRETTYSPFAQQLAEHGYVVLSVDPQGQGLSQRDPAPEYCGPGGQWREPQEAGLEERGVCAGHDPTSEGEAVLVDERLQPLLEAARAGGDPVYEVALNAAILISLRADPTAFMSRLPKLYDSFRTRFTFTGIDAVDWLVSSQNPWQSLVDVDRVGIAGHSAGADAAIVAGNAHRDRRFRAAVAWDTFGSPPFKSPEEPLGMVATIPTMIHQSEQAQGAFPWGPEPPDPELFPSYRTFERFNAAGVASYLLALRGSTHNEWQWFPDALTPVFRNASSKGQQVSLYYTVAWFDRWLKGHGSRVHADHARQRLTGAQFDDTADRSSIGQGTYDPINDANVPYQINGELVESHLSRLFNTKYDFDGLDCPKRLAGCS
jgi:dienelactone hydrolase